MFICFKVLEHGTAIADRDDEQELIQTQQDTMSDLEKSEVWHRIQCVPTTLGNLSNRRFLRSDGNRKLISLPIHVSRHFG